jgi:hypothetical protein
MKIKMNLMAIIVFGIIFGGIGITMAADVWATTSDKIPVTYKEGEYAGAYNPVDIRGSYTFEEISTLFDINLKVLYQAFGIPQNTDGTQFKSKDLEPLYQGTDYEIGNKSVQAFVALYKNLPIDLEDVYLPKQAVDIIIKENNQITQEQLEFMKSHQVELSNINGDIDVAKEEQEDNEETYEEDNLIKGSTTFQQALDSGISKEQIEKIIGSALPPANQTVKDYCINTGLTFSDIKDQLNQLLQ